MYAVLAMAEKTPYNKPTGAREKTINQRSSSLEPTENQLRQIRNSTQTSQAGRKDKCNKTIGKNQQ